MTEVTLPKGVDQETFSRVEEIILSGFENKQTSDAIKSAIFTEGVPFSKLNTLYSLITKAHGLVVDPKVVNAAIEEALDNIELDFSESYSELSTIAQGESAKIKGCTEAKFIAALKKVFKENESEFPRKPAASRGRLGVINTTLINVFKKNKTATQAELEKALAKVTKTPKNANDYTKQYYKMCYAIANELSALEVRTVFSSES